MWNLEAKHATRNLNFIVVAIYGPTWKILPMQMPAFNCKKLQAIVIALQVLPQ